MIRLATAVFLLSYPTLVHAADAPKAAAPRAARSVHLHYPAPDADAFYNEVTVERSVPGSYFMACGFRHGYFGIQELSGGRKVVLFSVWDASRGDDAEKVPLEQRVEVLHQTRPSRSSASAAKGPAGRASSNTTGRLAKRAASSSAQRSTDRRPPTPLTFTSRRKSPGSTWSPSAPSPAATA